MDHADRVKKLKKRSDVQEDMDTGVGHTYTQHNDTGITTLHLQTRFVGWRNNRVLCTSAFTSLLSEP
jgi:ribosomal protein S11